jgi:hypothetical protein
MYWHWTHSSLPLSHADLHKVGGLPTLLELLGSQQPSLRWRAAEVVATCVANNPPVQKVRCLSSLLLSAQCWAHVLPAMRMCTP